jgi:hypothetical protein
VSSTSFLVPPKRGLNFDRVLIAVAEVLRTMCLVLRDIFKKTPSEALLQDNYGRLCLIVDEMIYEVGTPIKMLKSLTKNLNCCESFCA